MFFTSTEAIMTWIAPALLGGVLGLLTYLGIDSLHRNPFLAVLFSLLGMIVFSVVAYGFRRFLLPRNREEFDDEPTK